MSKSFFVVIFSLLSLSEAFATPLQHLMHVERPPHAPEYKSLSQSVLTTQNYTDFTGQWSGICRADEEEQSDRKKQGDEKESLDIKNNRDWIQICYKGECDDYDVGKDISQHEMLGEGFFVEHDIFSWSSATSLAFNFVAVFNDALPSGKHAVSSMSGRSTFTLKEDKLIVQHEISEFDHAEEATQSKFVCELVRQPIT